MRCLSILLAGLLPVLASTAAVASPCSSDDDSGSDSSSGSSSDGGSSSNDYDSSSYDDSDDSSSATEGVPACVNSTEIIGRAECTRFGGWDRRMNVPMRLTMAATGGTVTVAGMDFDGKASHTEVHNYHYPTEATVRNRLETIGLAGLELQGTSFISERVHLGFHSAFALGSSRAEEKAFGDLVLRPQTIVQLSVAGIAGMSVPLGSWSLRSEALIGLRATNLSIETQHGDCVDLSSAWNNEWLLEPRVGLEKWLNPWLSAGLMVGSDLMQQGDMTIALGLTGHTTPRDNSGVFGLGR